MKPDVSRVLDVCALQLLGEVSPGVQPAYRQASVMATAVLLTSIREELDRVAERRVDENRALQALFERALPALEDAGLRERLAAAAAAPEPGLRIAELDRRNDDLRALLVELHAHVETLDSAEARRVEDEIWQELAASTERRRLSLGMF